MNALPCVAFPTKGTETAWECLPTWPKIRNQLHSYVRLVLSVPLDTNFTELWLDCGRDRWDFILSIWVLASLPTALVTFPILRIFNSSIRKNAEISVLLVHENYLHWRQGDLNRRDNFWSLWLLVFQYSRKNNPKFLFQTGYRSPLQICLFTSQSFPDYTEHWSPELTRIQVLQVAGCWPLGTLMPIQYYQSS